MGRPRSADLAITVIVLAEMFGTSLWFSVNAVADALQTAWRLQPNDLGHLTSAVQAGFIAGTFLLVVAGGIAGRFSACIPGWANMNACRSVTRALRDASCGN